MSYQRGDLAEVQIEVRNAKEELADPASVKLEVLSPIGTTTEPTVTKSKTGVYTATIDLDEPGVWSYRFSTEGNPQVAEDGELVVEEDAFDGAEEAATRISWRPSLEDVAALIWARTRVPGGKQIGTFSDETTPTGAEVERIIGMAVRRVTARISASPCTADLQADARSAAAIYAALRIETSYWPEQSRSNESAAAGLRADWKEQIADLANAVAEQCGGAGEGAGGTLAVAGIEEDELLGRTYPEAW